MQSRNNTSWTKVAPWYDKIVGTSGHYYHENVIFPNLKNILSIKPGKNVLDIGCGQGVFAKLLPQNVTYTGIDLSKDLISKAIKTDHLKSHNYYVADATLPLPVEDSSFDYVISILALQNMSDGKKAIENMAMATKEGGEIILVLNHPAFRIPRQSSWEIDDKNKLEYRRINRYMTSLEVPITAHPGAKQSPVTWSYHNPISYYVQALAGVGCAITNIYEWVSDKKSQGKAKKMEDRSRSEFPLFLTICAKKLNKNNFL